MGFKNPDRCAGVNFLNAISIGKGKWKISDAVNVSHNFHILEGLEPGTEYTIRLMAKNWFDNTSIFEDVIETRGKGEALVPFKI